MPAVKRYELTWGNRPLIIEFNRLANQATGSCTVQYGDTMVLATAVISESTRPDISYFPLQVEYKENMYAAGKISGSRFIKREGRPSEQSVLSARIIDRSIRPLFDDRWRRDIQVVITVLSYDDSSDPDIAGLIGAAAALMTSSIPWNGPLAGCMVASKDGQFHLNPNADIMASSDLNIFVSGRNNQVVMLEADGREASEATTMAAIEFGVQQLEPVITLLNTIQQELGQPKLTLPNFELAAEELTAHTAAKAKAAAYFTEHGDSLFGPGNKHERHLRQATASNALAAQFSDDDSTLAKVAVAEFESLFAKEMIRRIFTEGKRVDNRGLDDIRPLSATVGFIPRVHGSGLFSRGDTQILSIVTLSSPNNEQIFDTMRLDEKRRYFHHYNFPPYSVGEAGPMRGPGRREIGHGALAEKALLPVLPNKEQFPYTIRVVSEVLSSNGSSSQGSACGSSLALMDAGVPITRPVAGIAMGIAFQDDSKDHYTILTDLQDVEDYDRSMDFKVAGTNQGITAIQLDIKFDGLTMVMVRDTLTKAKTGRDQILAVMAQAIAAPRAELSPYAPRVETIQIDPQRIGELIGPGGKVINSIIDQTGVAIDIEDSGLVYVTSVDKDAMEQAKQLISDLLREVEVGEVYTGTVVKIVTDRNTQKEIGAIVELTAQHTGMIHISQVDNRRIDKVSDILKEGDQVKVKVLEVDRERGRIALSRKALL
ncbi:MAG: polyribonucleotide nucleotidyltransferase [Candidatus Kerfeldbacteria bacterium]|nr:polyribonucleotide nucleotidyltransferase [Candidatus Kerfeldbacteria bacterium]